MTTPDIIITVFGALLTIGLGIIIHSQRIGNAERKEDRERLIRIETRLEGLDSMRGDITSNRHKIANLDKGMVEIVGRVTVIEKMVDGIKVFCNKNHMGNL